MLQNIILWDQVEKNGDVWELIGVSSNNTYIE
jgi:hypothetical protein